jgi:hypothetical protein
MLLFLQCSTSYFPEARSVARLGIEGRLPATSCFIIICHASIKSGAVFSIFFQLLLDTLSRSAIYRVCKKAPQHYRQYWKIHTTRALGRPNNNMAAPNPGSGSRGLQPSSSAPTLTITSPTGSSSRPGLEDGRSPSMRSGRTGRFGSMVAMNAILRDMSSLSLDQQDLGGFGWEPDPPDLEEDDDEHGPLWMGGREETTPRHSSRSPAGSASPAQSVRSVAGGPLAGRHGFWTDRLPPGFLSTSQLTSTSNTRPFGANQPTPPGFPHIFPEASSSRTSSGEVAAGGQLAGSQLASPFSSRPFGVDLNTPPGWQPMPPGWPAALGDTHLSRTQSGPLTASSQLAIPPSQLLQRTSQSPSQQQASRYPDAHMSRARSAQDIAANQLVQLGGRGGSPILGRRRQRSGAHDCEEQQAQRQRCQREVSACSLGSTRSAVRGSSVDSIGNLDVESRASSSTSEKSQVATSAKYLAAMKIQGGSIASSKIQGGSSASSKRSRDSPDRGESSEQGSCAQACSEQDSRQQRGPGGRHAPRSPGSRRDRDTISDRSRSRDRGEGLGGDEPVVQVGSAGQSREQSRDQEPRSFGWRSPRLMALRHAEEQRGLEHVEEQTDVTSSRGRQRGSSGRGKGKSRRGL